MTRLPVFDQQNLILGSVMPMLANPHLYVAGICRANQGIARFRILNQHFVATTRLDIVRHWMIDNHTNYPRTFPHRNIQMILGRSIVSSEGSFWVSRRRFLQQEFRTGRLDWVVNAAINSLEPVVERWDLAANTGESVALVAEMRWLTLNTIFHRLFSTGIDTTTANGLANSVAEGLKLVLRRMDSPIPFWMPTPTHLSMRKVGRQLQAYLKDRITTRRASGTGAGDILDVLMAARDPETGQALSDLEIHSELCALIVGGFETTTATLTWALYALAQHPEIAEKLTQELDNLFGTRLPDMQTLAKATYLQQVIQEVLRMYPPFYSLSRESVAEDEIAGFRIPAGIRCLVGIYGIHHSPEFWKNPEQFLPDRFAPTANWHHDAWLPFGAGKHLCIGNNFAMLEISTVLTLLLRRYRFDSPSHIQPKAQVTLVPERPVRLFLQRR